MIPFNVTSELLSSVDDFGTRHVLPGEHVLIVTRGHGSELRQALRVTTVGDNRLVISTMAGLFGQTEADLGL